MRITATQINYFNICKRKLWLFSNAIQMEHNSDSVTQGKLIAENTYQYRNEKYKEIQIGPIKIDHYDHKNKIIHEVKKSSKMEAAHIMQVKYYIYILEQNGIDGCTGILEYPKIRETTQVVLLEDDKIYFTNIESEINALVSGQCPEVIDKPFCKTCSYYEFCYVREE